MDELLACQQGGAEDAGVVAQGGALDADEALGVGEGLGARRGPDQVDVGGPSAPATPPPMMTISGPKTLIRLPSPSPR